jgi:hypothetical protein
MQYVNSTNLGLTMALWLAADTYDRDYKGAPEGVPIVSVTDLLKPTKSAILTSRIPKEQQNINLVDLAKSRIGQSIHSGIEAAFEHPHREEILVSLGFAPKVAANLMLDPTPGQLKANPSGIPIYLEKRSYRTLTASDGTEVCIAGKFDQAVGGVPEDNKSTSTYKYMKSDKTEKGEYALQMACYKWLNPDIITAPIGKINFILTDWKQSEVGRNPDYPPHPVMEMQVNLMDETAAEEFLRGRVDAIIANKALPEADITRCTDEELWRSDPVYKYYKNPETAKKNGRATKNFASYPEAMAHKAKVGVGEIIIKPGEVRRCSYCDGAPLCTQRLEYQSQ